MNLIRKLLTLNYDVSIILLTICSLIIYWFGIIRHIELPGLYMDSINPDYLAAHILNPGLNNPVWLLPTRWFPIIGNLYHGVQNLYIGIPLFWMLGTNIVAARIAQAIFGSLIIVLVFFIVLRISRHRLLAVSAALCLATDVSFIASFRTQNYIILGGMAWLLMAFLPLVGNPEPHFSRKRILASGVFFGLAIYGYFVHIFFMPVFICAVIHAIRREQRLVGTFVWCVGVAFGILPYLFGYLSMGLALGGVSELLGYLKNVTQGLAPFSSTFSLYDSYKYAFAITKVAMTNRGNELMIFGESITSGLWTDVKFGSFVVMIVLMIAYCLYDLKKGNREQSTPRFLLVLLPCSYLLFAGLFGKRLWAHHFSVMIPFLYLVGPVSIYELNHLLKALNCKPGYDTIKQAAVAVACGVVLVCNVAQQNSFFKQLDHIGGAGKMSNSLTLLANEALSNPSATVYLFPEWGFFMPFSFLTANRIPYRLDISKEIIDEICGKYEQISVAFWEGNDAEKYIAQLRSLGIENALLRVYTRRDAMPAFYLLTAQL